MGLASFDSSHAVRNCIVCVRHGSALIANDSSIQNMPVFVAGCVFSSMLLQGIGIAFGHLLQRVFQLRVYRYAGLAMLVAAAVVSLFPGINGFMINLIEK
jgi:urease accessory protein